MNCGRYCGIRNFFTKKENIEMLKEYKEDLENEAEGVGEKIKEMENFD